MTNKLIPGLVTVILPTHNRRMMLEKAIRSVLNQDYQDFELIIVLDSCSDDSASILNKYSDSRIQLIDTDVNIGGAQARNLGIKAANGEYVAFLDDDDVWKKNKLSNQLKIFKRYNDTAIVSTGYDENNGQNIQKIKIPSLIDLNDLLYLNYCGSFSFCMTKNEYINDSLINSELKACQDWDLWVKILYKTGLKCRSFKEESLVVYHTGHKDRLSTHIGNIYKSRVLLLRSHFNKMKQEHLYYNLYEMLKLKRLAHWDEMKYTYRLQVYIKALKYYHKSKYRRSFYNYLLIITKILNLS